MAHKMSGAVAVTVALVVLVMATGGGGGGGVMAEVHHVVGGDRGWEPSNIIGDWSSGRVFTVGDIIWFAYSTAHDSIVELGNVEEYESCDLSNPIRTYTDGVGKISLDGEGIRYFASGNIENCKKGLKLPVNVQPQVNGPTSAESPLGYWPIYAESSIIDRPSLETKQAQSPSMGYEYGPTTSLPSAESPLEAGSEWPTSSSSLDSHNGLLINEMFGQKKWAKWLSDKEADGPTSHSAPINLSGLFGLFGPLGFYFMSSAIIR